MKRKAISGVLVLAMLGGSSIAQAAGPSASMLAYTCAGCHGTDGSSVGPASPSIAASDPTYFTDVMLAYKNAERPSTVMTRIAKGYSEEEIEAMAEFFADQKFIRFPQQYDAAKASRGKELHEEYCEKCHEDGGRNPEDSSVLAGQWMPYLHIAMEEYLNKERDMPKKMKSKVEALIEKEGKASLDDVIHYYGSQQ